jgi:anti-sigma factor RsiW
MKDREFIRLLNLYVDREISAQDALRLETEVASHPERRRVYEQYCRIQKACRIIAEDEAAGAAPADIPAAEPVRGPWRLTPVFGSMAIAALMALAVYGFRGRPDVVAARPDIGPSRVAAAPAEPMKPVFATRVAPQADAGVRATLLANDATNAHAEQLDWIGGISLTPVGTQSDTDLFVGPKAGARDSSAEAPVSGSDEPAEMAAFRFQR